MQQQSGVAPGGDGRVRAAFGDRVSGVNIISNMNGVGGSGGGDIAMATGGNSSSGMDAFGRSSEAGQGAARHTSDAAGEQGAQTLEQLMATILRNALQGEGAAAGSGTC